MSSGILELARGRESGVDPDGDSDMGTETGVRKEFGSSGGSGSIGPRDEVGEHDRATGGGLKGVTVKTGVATSKFSATSGKSDSGK